MTLTLTLPKDVADFIEQQVALKRYEDSEQVVIDALRTLSDESSAAWTPEQELKDAAVAYDEMEKDPSASMPIEAVQERLRRRYAASLAHTA